MFEKMLKITFNGISTLAPGPPRNGDPDPEKAFVLMPANRAPRKYRSTEVLDPHFAFLYVPVAVLAEPIPRPVYCVDDEKLGRCNIYFVDNARVVLDPPPLGHLKYFIDHYENSGHPKDIKERPGSDDVASEHDIRWLPDIRDIFPDNADLDAAADPRSRIIGKQVAMVVELPAGTLKANFPCKSVQPKTFDGFKQKHAHKPKPRVYANEFVLEMQYPSRTEDVRLKLTSLRPTAPISGLDKRGLILEWKGEQTIELRMGNDTASEIVDLQSMRRCDARSRRTLDGKPKPLPILDNDFDLHYDVLAIPSKLGRPVPHNGPHQTKFNGCVPLSAGLKMTGGGS